MSLDSRAPGSPRPRPVPLRTRLVELGRWYLSTWTDPEYRWGAVLAHVLVLAATVLFTVLSEQR